MRIHGSAASVHGIANWPDSITAWSQGGFISPDRGYVVGAVGIEPTTFGLKGRCSTTELRP